MASRVVVSAVVVIGAALVLACAEDDLDRDEATVTQSEPLPRWGELIRVEHLLGGNYAQPLTDGDWCGEFVSYELDDAELSRLA